MMYQSTINDVMMKEYYEKQILYFYKWRTKIFDTKLTLYMKQEIDWIGLVNSIDSIDQSDIMTHKRFLIKCSHFFWQSPNWTKCINTREIYSLVLHNESQSVTTMQETWEVISNIQCIERDSIFVSHLFFNPSIIETSLIPFTIR